MKLPEVIEVCDDFEDGYIIVYGDKWHYLLYNDKIVCKNTYAVCIYRHTYEINKLERQNAAKRPKRKIRRRK